LIASLVLALAPACVPQAPPAPWCELEPVIAESSWILTAEVVEARAIGSLGTRVELELRDTLHGRRPPRTFSYLADRGRLVLPGEVELLFLQPPLPGGHHHRVRGRVAARDRHHAAKRAWLERALTLRRRPAEEQGKAHLDWYQSSLTDSASWEFWRALAEIERLSGARPVETRQLLDPDRLEEARDLLEPGAARKRLEALIAWRKQESPGG
jgi:hypothetical protein